MVTISSSMIDNLRSRLTTAIVLTPDSEGYLDSLVRWSDTGRKQAVCDLSRQSREDTLTIITMIRELSSSPWKSQMCKAHFGGHGNIRWISP